MTHLLADLGWVTAYHSALRRRSKITPHVSRFLPVHVNLDGVQVPQHAHRADLALELGLGGDVPFPLAYILLLVVPLQMIHDLRDVLRGERAEVALK